MIYNMKSINPDVVLVFLLFEMIFAHLIADFNLQGILAKMKQKQWWIDTLGEDLYNKNYKNDYKISLLAHSFMWSFTIHILLLILYTPNYKIFLSIIINTILHYIIDDLKANKLKIDLVDDQLLHISQILNTLVILVMSHALPLY